MTSGHYCSPEGGLHMRTNKRQHLTTAINTKPKQQKCEEVGDEFQKDEKRGG